MSTYPSITSQPGSAQRNLDPIVDALTPLIESSSQGSRILELASFPYEHISAFAKKWDKLEWWGTCRNANEVNDVLTKMDAENGTIGALSNLKRPRQLDVTIDEDWLNLSQAVSSIVHQDEAAFQGAIMLNLIHCCPPDVPDHVFKHLSPKHTNSRPLLDPQTGWIAAYGAFKNDDGTYKSAADEQFDRDYIRAKDPSLGLRSIASITETAERWGFVEYTRREMPKGNMFVVWRVGS